MKLPLAALVLLIATSFATPAKASPLPLASPEAELQQAEAIQPAIASQACLTCDVAQFTETHTKQSRRPRQTTQQQQQRRQEIRQQREQQRQRNAQQQERQRQEEARRQQQRQRQAQEQERQRQAQEIRRNAQAQEQQRQEEARRQQERERQEQQRQEEARREWQEERDRDRQEEAREDWREDRDRYYDHDYYDNDGYDYYDNDDYDYDIWRRDRYQRYDWYDHPNLNDDWEERERDWQEEAARRNRERQAAVWRDWEERQNVLRWHWDTWQRTYRPSLVGTTLLELTSLDNNWTTVLIEGIDIAQEVSFTGSGVQTVYLSPGAYRIQFSPVLSDNYWQSGYLVVGRTNRLRIMFDQNNESVQVFDDPAAWTPGDRLPGYPDNDD